jgi:hypothetical protein
MIEVVPAEIPLIGEEDLRLLPVPAEFGRQDHADRIVPAERRLLHELEGGPARVEPVPEPIGAERLEPDQTGGGKLNSDHHLAHPSSAGPQYGGFARKDEGPDRHGSFGAAPVLDAHAAVEDLLQPAAAAAITGLDDGLDPVDAGLGDEDLAGEFALRRARPAGEVADRGERAFDEIGERLVAGADGIEKFFFAICFSISLDRNVLSNV